jgi:hypothetical protein
VRISKGMLQALLIIFSKREIEISIELYTCPYIYMCFESVE